MTKVWRMAPALLGVLFCCGMGMFRASQGFVDPGPYVVAAIMGVGICISLSHQERRIAELEVQAGKAPLP